jgi:hypothetical protein
VTVVAVVRSSDSFRLPLVMVIVSVVAVVRSSDFFRLPLGIVSLMAAGQAISSVCLWGSCP